MILCLSLYSVPSTSADFVYDYQSYFGSLPGAIFKDVAAHTFVPYSTENDEIRFELKDTLLRDTLRIQLTENEIFLDGNLTYLSNAKIFPGEFAGSLDGSTASLYIYRNIVCLEASAVSASGSAARHIELYVFMLTKKRSIADFWKLPSLFATCKGIRINAKKDIIFPKISYRYEDAYDFPVGTIIEDYSIMGEHFQPSRHVTRADFVDPENVYKFVIKTFQ